LFEFFKFLRGAAGVDDTLYIFFQSSLAAMMELYVHEVKCVLRLQDVFPFVLELATRLSHALELSVQSTEFIQLSKSDVWVFIKFMHPVKCAIQRREAFGSPVSFSSLMLGDARNERFEIEGVNHVFCDSLRKIGVVSKGTGKPPGFGKQRKRLPNYTLLVPVSFNSKGVRKHFKVVEGSGGNVLGEFESKKSFKKL